jgi:phosphatidylglycerophosphatase A
MDHVFVFIATGMYSGMLPILPGVWGSALAVLLWSLCRTLSLSIYISITAGLFFIGGLAAGHAESFFAQKDASPIVIDEILGIFIALTNAKKIPYGWLFGFLSFIILDGLKPFPASWFDTHLPGGLGIMMDDLAVGIYAFLLLSTAIHFYSKKTNP